MKAGKQTVSERNPRRESITWRQSNLINQMATRILGRSLLDPIDLSSGSPTSADFLDIPSWVTKITVTGAGVSTNGTSALLLQLGDSGGIETTGYLGAASSLSTGAASSTSTTGFLLRQGSAANVMHLAYTFHLHDESSNQWVGAGSMAFDAAATVLSGGSKSLSGRLTTVRLTTVNGTDTFDAGSVALRFE